MPTARDVHKLLEYLPDLELAVEAALNADPPWLFDDSTSTPVDLASWSSMILSSGPRTATTFPISQLYQQHCQVTCLPIQSAIDPRSQHST